MRSIIRIRVDGNTIDLEREKKIKLHFALIVTRARVFPGIMTYELQLGAAFPPLLLLYHNAFRNPLYAVQFFPNVVDRRCGYRKKTRYRMLDRTFVHGDAVGLPYLFIVYIVIE